MYYVRWRSKSEIPGKTSSSWRSEGHNDSLFEPFLIWISATECRVFHVERAQWGRNIHRDGQSRLPKRRRSR